MSCGQCGGSLGRNLGFSRPELLLFHSISSSVVLVAEWTPFQTNYFCAYVWKQKINYRVHKRPSLVTTVMPAESIHHSPTQIRRVFKMVLLFTPRSAFSLQTFLL
jgi:hypothetical protein